VQESVDIHDVITKLYNVYLNNFIAKHHKGKIYSLTQTGGLMEVVRRTRSPLYAYRNWLDEYRMRLYRRYKKNVSFDELKEALEPLIQFYVNVYLFQVQNDFLFEDDLLGPLKQFFSNLDKELESDYFSKKIQREIDKSHAISLKITKPNGTPCQNLDVVFFIQENKTVGLTFTNTFRTNKEGEINTRLPTGTYRIFIPHMEHRETVNVAHDIKIERTLKKPSSISEGKAATSLIGVYLTKFLGLGAPYLVGLAIIVLQLSIKPLSSSYQETEQAVLAVKLFIIPSAHVISLAPWIMSGVLGTSLREDIKIPYISTYLLAWAGLFLVEGNIAYSLIQELINIYFWSEWIVLFFAVNILISLALFWVGSMAGLYIRKKIKHAFYY